MTATAKPWSRPYGGYHNAVRPAEDATLTHVGPGTPGGDYLRRFWHPVAMTAEVTDVPLAIRIMGEDLVLFRDRSGRYGLLHRHCTHRGTSLEWGIPQAKGLRCCYHGWTYDIDGTCLETPGEPPTSTLKYRIFQGAYLVKEYKGLVFAYMGPRGCVPDFPLYDTFLYPQDDEAIPYSIDYACNWLQSHENGADPVHTAYLHTIASGAQFTPAFAELPTMHWTETPIGLLSCATRRNGKNMWIRASDVIVPNSAQFGVTNDDSPEGEYGVCAKLTRWVVPVDDTHNLTIGFRHFNSMTDPRGEVERDKIGRNKVDIFGQTAFRPRDEQQREPGDYEALVGQGPVAIHAAEHLSSTDRGVVMLRRQLRQGIESVSKGEAFKAPRLDGREVIPTYNHKIVHPVAKQNDIDDTEVAADFGHRVANIVIESAAESPDRRQAWVEGRVKQTL